MATTSEDQFKAPLGVGSIVGESFSILFRNIFAVMLLAFVPALLSLVVSGVLNGWGYAVGVADAQGGGFGILAETIINSAIYGIITALLVQLAYDAKLDREIRIKSYVGPAVRSAVTIALLSFAVGILAGLAMIALILPGLWVYAVYAVVAPTVVIEGVGYGGMKRSAELTKGYRWPIVGVIVLVGISTVLLSGALLFAVVFVSEALFGDTLFLTIIIASLAVAVVYGLIGISVSLIYARLREIKEGVSVDQIASVFD